MDDARVSSDDAQKSLKITISRRVRWISLAVAQLRVQSSQNNYLTQGEMDLQMM